MKKIVIVFAVLVFTMISCVDKQETKQKNAEKTRRSSAVE